MSILSEAFDGFVDYVSNLGGDGGFRAPGASSPGPLAPSSPSDSFPSLDSIGRIVGPALQFAGPLIKGTVARTKPPEPPKFPGVPASVKNDPRVQALVGSYGALDGTIPTIGKQQFPSVFQQSFPAMFDAVVNLVTPTPPAATVAAVNKSQATLNTAAGASSNPVTPEQVATVTVGQADDGASLANKLLEPGLSKQATDAVTKTSQYDPLFQEAAKKYGIDVNVLRSFAQQESNGDPNAVGYAANAQGHRAKGLMQLMPDAAKDAAGHPVADEELFKPATNIDLGAKYIASIVKQLGGADGGQANYDRVFTAYYQGVDGSKDPEKYAKAKGYRDQMYRRVAANKKYYG